jgi:hypothetical protein
MHRASGLLHWVGGFDTCSRFHDLVEWFSRVFLYIGWGLLDIWVGEQIITSNVWRCTAAWRCVTWTSFSILTVHELSSFSLNDIDVQLLPTLEFFVQSSQSLFTTRFLLGHHLWTLPYVYTTGHPSPTNTCTTSRTQPTEVGTLNYLVQILSSKSYYFIPAIVPSPLERWQSPLAPHIRVPSQHSLHLNHNANFMFGRDSMCMVSLINKLESEEKRDER